MMPDSGSSTPPIPRSPGDRFESTPDTTTPDTSAEEEAAQSDAADSSESPIEMFGEDAPTASPSSPRRDYSIGEVADRVDLEAHVLRYWETEFPQLKPVKDDAGRRVYREADIRIVERIRHLLKEEKYTIAGARAVLDREGVHGRKAFRDELRDLRDFLVRLRDEL